MTQPPVSLRRFAPDDSLSELTGLLNIAYQQLADMGLEYVATWQDERVTAKRIRDAECWVAVERDRLVGTLTLTPPGRGRGHTYYERPDVSKFSQFGVLPEFQGRGVGSLLLDRAEERARALGAKRIACDTAEPAHHLQAYYRERGYEIVAHADWDVVNYESVILAKSLVAEPDRAS